MVKIKVCRCSKKKYDLIINKKLSLSRVQTVHHLNSQECAWAFLRIKDLFFEKGPMPLHYNMRMHYEKRVGKGTP